MVHLTSSPPHSHCPEALHISESPIPGNIQALCVLRQHTPRGNHYTLVVRIVRQVVKSGKVKRSGKGGVHRAFVRLRCLGMRGRPDLKAVAADFTEAKDKASADFQQAAAMAAAAKDAMRLCKGKASQAARTFGPNSRDARRSRVHAAQMAVWRRTNSMDPEGRLQAVGDHILSQGLSLRESLAMARAAARFDAAKVRGESEQAMRSLVAYQQGPGMRVVEELQLAAPSLASFTLRAVPHHLGTCVEAQPPDPAAACSALAAVQGTPKTNLGAALEAFWEQTHRQVMESDCLPLGQTRLGEPSACYAAGVCICSGKGLVLAGMVGGFVARMKAAFPPQSDARRLLLEGHIVAHLVGEPDTEDYEELIALDEEEAFQSTFLHIGLMYLKPFRPTFLTVAPVENSSEAPGNNGRLYVQAWDPQCVTSNSQL